MRKLISIENILFIYLFIFYLFQTTSNKIDNERNGALIFKNLHKCSCLANEVWFMNSCLENSTTIKVLVDMYSSDTQIINTTTIEHVEVGEVICPLHFLNITLPGESFALSTSGELFNLKYGLNLEFSKYCVEHFYNEDRNEVDLEVHLCVPVPSVPKCCPDDMYDKFNHICRENNTSEVVVPFKLGKNSYETESESYFNVLDCHDGDNRTYISMSQTSSNAELKLMDKGLVLIHQVTVFGDKLVIPSTEYCLQYDNDNKVIVAASYCYVKPIDKHMRNCNDKACLRKCCPSNQIYDMDNFKCITVNPKKRWNPKIYEHKTDIQVINHSFDLKQVFGFPIDCEFFTLSINNDPPDEFMLMQDGSLFVKNWDQSIPAHQYCVDNFKYNSKIIEEALVCFIENIEESGDCKQMKNILYPILVLVSCIFLLITLVVYAIIPELHVKVQGKCLISSISSLIGAYLCMVLVQLASNKLSHGGCVALGLFLQFTTLSSFFWLNVMSFDIWRTLRSRNTGPGSPYNARKRFILYSVYAWGVPLFITVVTAIMQYVLQYSENSNIILPRIGETDCFFPSTDKRPQWAYFYGFISATLIINTYIFISLAVFLIQAKQTSEAALGKKNQIHKEWAKLYLKLFLIMGITWIFEVVSWVEGSCVIWIVTDIINSLRGLLIFIIFVCKRDVIKKLRSKSSPAFHRMRATMTSSTFLSRSSKRTSNFYIDPSVSFGSRNQNMNQNHADVKM